MHFQSRGLRELVDVVASTTVEPPVVTALFIDRDDGQLAASWAQVAEIDVDGERVLLGVPLAAVKAASLRPDELSLVDALLDNQALDMRRRTFVRVQDVVLEPDEDHLVVAGVDASGALHGWNTAPRSPVTGASSVMMFSVADGTAVCATLSAEVAAAGEPVMKGLSALLPAEATVSTPTALALSTAAERSSSKGWP